jgi:hypothetical protein
MGIVDLFERKTVITESEAAALRSHAVTLDESKGITAADVLRVFPGAAILTDKPASCGHCSKESVPEWRRGGRIVKRTWLDGRTEWCCHFCGREVKNDE